MGGLEHGEDVKLLRGWKDSRLLAEPSTKLLPDGPRCWRIKAMKIKTREPRPGRLTKENNNKSDSAEIRSSGKKKNTGSHNSDCFDGGKFSLGHFGGVGLLLMLRK